MPSKAQPKSSKTTQSKDTEGEREKKLRKAYGQATAELRGRYQMEFNTLYAKYAKELGVDWHPRLTPEQRAEAQLEMLLADYPHLRDRLAEHTGDDESDEETHG